MNADQVQQALDELNAYFAGAYDATLKWAASQPKSGLLSAQYQAAKATAQHLIRIVDDLSWVAIDNRAVRHRLAEERLVEKLISKYRDKEDTLLVPFDLPGKMREALLENLYRSTAGGLFGAPDLSGLTEWVGSEESGIQAWADALRNDKQPALRAQLLKITRDGTFPASWLARLKQDRVFEAIDVQTREAPWTQAERRVVSALTGQTDGRVSAELAKLSVEQLAALAKFPTGDNALVPTPAPPVKAWWRNGWVYLSGVAALAAGAGLASRNRSRNAQP